MKKKLLMEGNNDTFVAGSAWLRIVGTDARTVFLAVDCKGIGNMPDRISLEMKSGNDALGIVIDADEDITEGWKMVKKALAEFGVTLPNLPQTEGFISTNHAVKAGETPTKIGVWVMPDNVLPGKIEDFLEMLVPLSDELLPEVNVALDTIEQKGKHKYGSKDRLKALMHTWLAWQETPGMPYGQAITVRYLSTDEQICQDFVTWLKRLFL
jgi:hypothetical protein